MSKKQTKSTPCGCEEVSAVTGTLPKVLSAATSFNFRSTHNDATLLQLEREDNISLTATLTHIRNHPQLRLCATDETKTYVEWIFEVIEPSRAIVRSRVQAAFPEIGQLHYETVLTEEGMSLFSYRAISANGQIAAMQGSTLENGAANNSGEIDATNECFRDYMNVSPAWNYSARILFRASGFEETLRLTRRESDLLTPAQVMNITLSQPLPQSAGAAGPCLSAAVLCGAAALGVSQATGPCIGSATGCWAAIATGGVGGQGGPNHSAGCDKPDTMADIC